MLKQAITRIGENGRPKGLLSIKHRDEFIEKNKEHLGFWRRQKKPKNP